MQLSYNILVIKSLSIDVYNRDNQIIRLNSKLEACIKFNCPVTGRHFKSINIVADNRGYSEDEALRNVIQDFIDGKVYTSPIYYSGNISCFADHTKIHAVDVQLQEPFKPLFDQLFNTTEWKMPQLELTH